MIRLNLQKFGGRGTGSGMSSSGASNSATGSQYNVGDTVSNGSVTLTKVSSGKWESDTQVVDAATLAGPDRRLVSSKAPRYEVIENDGSFTVFERGLNRRTRLKKVKTLQKAMSLMD